MCHVVFVPDIVLIADDFFETYFLSGIEACEAAMSMIIDYSGPPDRDPYREKESMAIELVRFYCMLLAARANHIVEKENVFRSNFFLKYASAATYFLRIQMASGLLPLHGSIMFIGEALQNEASIHSYGFSTEFYRTGNWPLDGLLYKVSDAVDRSNALTYSTYFAMDHDQCVMLFGVQRVISSFFPTLSRLSDNRHYRVVP